MPTVDAPTAVRITLPGALYDHYLGEADAAGVDVEDLLAARLEAAKDYRAAKPVYFDDAERRELERLLGRNVLHSADALIQIRNALAVRVNKVIISLKPNLLAKLKSRAVRQDFDKFLTERIIQALEEYVGLR